MAAPTFVAAGTASSGTGTTTPGLPSGWAADDIHILLIQTSNQVASGPSGWTAITNSPQGYGTAGAGGSTRITAYWRRAVAGDTGPTVPDPGQHNISQILGFRGCPTSGDPWDVTSGSADNKLAGSNIPGDTTTVNDCLVVLAVADGFDSASTARYSGWTNADLGSLTERYDGGNADGAGGGFGIATGTKASSGAYTSTAVTTAQLGSGHNRAMMSIALKGASSMPTFVAAGTAGTGIGNLTPGLPSGWAADDIHLLFVETISSQSASAPSGWTEVADSPQSVGGTIGSVRLTTFWRRAVAGDTGPTVTDPGDHGHAVIVGFRGCVTSGDPWDVTSAGTFDGRVVTIPGATTTVANCLVVAIAAHSIDTTSAQFTDGSWTNADLASVTERADSSTNASSGGGFGVATGTKASIGTFGSTTATMASPSGNAYLAIALKPMIAVATVEDAIATLSEVATRVATISRAVADSLSSLTETVVRSPSITRTLADSISSITEAVERALTIGRTVSDSISSITDSDAVARVGAFARTAADSVSSISEAVEATVGAISVAVADSISAISESVTRVLTLDRAASDSVSFLTATVARIATVPRALADSISSITQSVGRTLAIGRTVADSVSSISVAVTRAWSGARAIADIIAGIFEAALGRAPFHPPLTTTVDLTIDGVSVWAETLYQKAHFESQINGVAGNCSFRVRDEDRTKSFTQGDEIILSVDGQRLWRGFVSSVNRVYVFDALNVADFGLTRFIDIIGTDINILLTKRVVFKQSDPAKIEAPLLAPYTPDITAIRELFANWLDLSGDGLDTTTYVQNVADTVWSQEGRAWEGGDTWAQAMQSIANLPGAIYCIDPDKHFVYTDVDTPNAPFALSDQPDYSLSFGYSEMEVLKDGTGLANDVLAWGIGYGSQRPVFTRAQDAASQSEHGLWQVSQETFGVYKQSTIERIAESILLGSPQNKRGSKDDRVSVQCVTYQSGLRVAQKVDFTSNVFGFNDVLPVRKMDIDFPAPDKPKYTLTLSHEIDTPFSFFDNYWFNYNFPETRVIVDPWPWPTPEGCSDAICGITDTFTRTVASGWGTSDSGNAWSTTYNSITSVNGTEGILTGTGTPTLDHNVTGLVDITAALTLTRVGTGLSCSAQLLEYNSDYSAIIYCGVAIGDADSRLSFTAGYDYVTDFDESQFYLNGSANGDKVWVRVYAEGFAFKAKVWLDGQVEPSGWDIEFTATVANPVLGDAHLGVQGVNLTAQPGSTIALDGLAISGVNRCTAAQFDDFNRTVASGWGAATPSGGVWTHVSPETGATASVTGSYGRATIVPQASGAPTVTMDMSAGWPTSSFDIVVSFRFSTVPNGSDGNRDTDIFFEVGNGTKLMDFNLYVSSHSGYGSVGTCGAAVVKTDWVANTWYVLRGRFDAATSATSVRVWPATSSEPGTWDATGTATSTALNFMDMYVNGDRNTSSGAQATQVVDFDSIDFDYDGKPCYLDCSMPPSMNVVRTPGQSYGWTYQDGSGIVAGPTQSSASARDESRFFGGNLWSRVLKTWDFGGTGYPDGTAANYRIGPSVVNVGKYDGSTLPNGTEVTFEIVMSSTGYDFDTGPASIDPGGTVVFSGSITSTGSPPSQLSIPALDFEGVLPTVNLYIRDTSGPVYTADGHRVTYSLTTGGGVNMTLLGGVCGPIPPGAGVPLNAWVCEQFDVVTTTLILAHPFLPNSAQVWLNGLLQPQSSYTEDAAAGTITFDSVPGPTDTARVCYWSLP